MGKPGRKPLDLAGRRFGKLVVAGRTDVTNHAGFWLWACDCDCGTRYVLRTRQQLGSKCNQHCGCMVAAGGDWGGARGRYKVEVGAKAAELRERYGAGGVAGVDSSEVE